MTQDQAHIQRIVDGRLMELRGKFEQSAALHHRGEMGSTRETILLDYLREELSDVASVFGSSEFIDAEGRVSPQVDLAVLSRGARPLIQQDCTLTPIESVLASIEVKSNLTTEELRKSCDNFARTSCLKRTAYATETPQFKFQGTMVDDWPTFGIIFAYKGIVLEKLFDRFYEWCAGHNAAERPHSIWVLNQGFITWGDDRGATAPSILDGLRIKAEKVPSSANIASMMAMILHDTFAGVQLPPFNLRTYYNKGVFSYGDTTRVYTSAPFLLVPFEPKPAQEVEKKTARRAD